ncbi:hypothetical protein DYB32_004947 [Aphanomyces invadans]|uniref:Amidohydrolase 3 domain-containing protein n=1 Tax=Aphanomyces invadans TaxID=157072 RepID=A0A3R6Y8W9_9STRA|nr:hypothetical protein DYB32_004947 [Aphanomyces invadans]
MVSCIPHLGVQTNDAHCLPLYHALQASNQLPLRVYMTPDHNEIDPHHHGCLDVGGPFQHDLITVDRVKLFADGSLGAETAALRQPYRDSTNQGILVHTNDDMVAKIRIAHEAGYRVEIHAIGAYAAKEESRLGDITPGFQADFVVIQYDPMAEESTKLLASDIVQRVFVQGIERFNSTTTPKSPLTVQASGLPGKNGKIRICRCCRV